MGKIVISLPILGEENFQKIAFKYADEIATEKGLDKNIISAQLNGALSIFEFKIAYDKFFRDEIILKVKNKKQ